jgi:hypothetical protein
MSEGEVVLAPAEPRGQLFGRARSCLIWTGPSRKASTPQGMGARGADGTEQIERSI